ncbi:hypothetical protein [Streptomyces agglomeratus]|uniref:hypothetical protein n=1 Tax=Streptomyces agglomeratus TaxID=285458 RepID=UPI00085466B3|nr:hypothetical protein [Streptomyces agglomeratus]OEJ36218.1 hypothetical protein BGK72_39140 [Streptomyces agglomeratus]OEJ52618.1 hypothetical protein BGK72_19445 [Streptomyces agglomeratus]
MFEIRIICEPADGDRITTVLSGVFETGTVRRYPSRGTEKDRLYVTADHRPHPQSWPTPEKAYTTAPSIISEIGWTARAATDKPFGQEIGREFWLRKAAVLDRIALADENAGIHGDATEVAVKAAQRLMDTDGAPVICEPRHYVRQQYARWAKNQ